MGVTKSIVVAIIVCISLLMVPAIAAFPSCSLPLSNVGVGFNNKSSFKVAMFADLHFGENAWEAWGPAQDVNSTAVMSKLLDQESPGAIKPHAPLFSRIPIFFGGLFIIEAHIISLFRYKYPNLHTGQGIKQPEVVISWVIREDASRKQVDGWHIICLAFDKFWVNWPMSDLITQNWHKWCSREIEI